LPPRPTDTAALRAFETLTGVSTPATKTGFQWFEPGDESTDKVCHLLTQSNPTEFLGFDFYLVTELFLSRSGSELLKIANARRKLYSKLSIDFRAMAILAELPAVRAQGEDADLFPGQIFEVVLRPVAPDTPEELALEVLKSTPQLASRLAPVIGMGREEFRDRVMEAAEDSAPGLIDEQISKVFAGILEFLAEQATNLSHFLDRNSRMPEEVWNPRKRPKDMADFLHGLGDALEKASSSAIEWFADRKLDLAGLAGPLAEIDAVAALIRQAEALWNKPRDFILRVANSIKDIIGSAGDSLDTLIGYVSGLWDGIIEGIIGFVELIALALRLAAKFLRANIKIEGAIDLVREVIDEIVQALMRIDWIEFWIRFMKEVVPLIIDLLKQKADAFIDHATRNSAMAGYYFGYLVYTIAEFFFPPLKLSKVSRAARAARTTLSANFFGKILE